MKKMGKAPRESDGVGLFTVDGGEHDQEGPEGHEQGE
jgi:hypothetical protein